jgi:putative DNA primase/helicase
LAVAIWPDADEPGTKAALVVAAELEKVGATVKIVEPPPDVATGWDLADAEAEGWTRQQIKAALKAANAPEEFKKDNTPATDKKAQIKVVSLEQLLAHEFPPRENILSPWLPSQGVVMVYAGRGIGKTFFSLSVGLAVASGAPFLKWQAERRKAVLLIDGEMPGAVLQERVAAFVAAQDLPPGDFRFITPDMQPNHQTIDLGRAEDQETVEQYLDGVGLIIVDNISTVCRSGRENEGESWLQVQEWALQQRAKGRSVLFIHHAGKGGNQRGTSRREDILDTVIALRRPTQYTPDMGAVFEIHFEKSRGIFGEDVEPIEATLIAGEDGIMTWSYRSVDVSTYDKVVGLLKEGLSVTEIATELEINKSTVSRHAKKAKANGDCNG